MAAALIRAITQNVLVEILSMDNGFTRLVLFDIPPQPASVNWAKRYPFRPGEAPLAGEYGIFKRMRQKITRLEEAVESYTGRHIAGQFFFAEAATAAEMIAGWALHPTVLDLGGGYLAVPVEEEDIRGQIATLAGFRSFLEQLNIDLLYVQAPNKICRNDTLPHTADFSARNMAGRIALCGEYGIPCIDLEERLHTENMDHHASFYLTDSHWTAETGLWAAGVIAGYLNGRNGFSIDAGLFSPEQYRSEVYENVFLGSWGRELTLKRAKLVNITLLYPRFPVDISFSVPGRNIDKRGPFDIMYDYCQLAGTEYYSRSAYYAYLYGGNPLVVIRNNLAPPGGGKKVLFIVDSYARVLLPFFAPGAAAVEALDLREFTGSVKTYIEQSRPDLVVVMYDLGSSADGFWNFR
jgi:hypothetical protein